MSNLYYVPAGVPAIGAPGRSADARAEFARVEAAFDKLPALTGNGGKLVKVDAGGTLLEASGLLSELSGAVVIGGGKVTGAGVTALLAAPTPIGSTTPSTGVFTTLRQTSAPPPGDASDLVATTAFVASVAFAASGVLPGQTGNDGGVLKTRAGAAFWSPGELEIEIVASTSFTIVHGKHYVLTDPGKTTGVVAASAMSNGRQFRVTAANSRTDNEIDFATNGANYEFGDTSNLVIDTKSVSAVYVNSATFKILP